MHPEHTVLAVALHALTKYWEALQLEQRVTVVEPLQKLLAGHEAQGPRGEG